VKKIIDIVDIKNAKYLKFYVENDIYVSDFYAESYIGIVKVKDIKSVITHEQMEKISYKVG